MAATTSPPRRPRTRIRFQLDSLDRSDGHVVLTGRWHGVRGLRFVRPTLIVDGDEVLATLEHKPWQADADPWVAEFPWEDGRVDPRRTALSVAPSVTVPLVWPGDVPDEEPVQAEGEMVSALQDQLRNLRIEYDALRGRLEAERDDLHRRLDDALAEQGALRDQIKKLEVKQRRETAASRRERRITQPRLSEADDDRPIGMRELTAADLLVASNNGGSAPGHEVSAGERIAIRLFGTAAFVCAFLLVANVLRLFF